MNVPATPLPADPLALDDQECELLCGELEALLLALPADRRGPYEALRQAVAQQAVPAELAGLLEGALALILDSGRARHALRAEGERILKAVYDRTPRGRQVEQDLARTNRALGALAGQHLTSVRAGCTSPGRHTITITAESLQLTLVVDRHGIHVDAVSI